MNTITRFSIIVGLLFVLGAAALLLQFYVALTMHNESLFPASLPAEIRLRELWHREQIAVLALTLLALAGITIAALLPRAQPRSATDQTARQGIELLARAAATQSEALTRERDVRLRTEENLAMEQLRAGQAVADKVRLGRDLHDGLIQSLYATGLTLALARQKMASEPAHAAALLDHGVEMLNTTLRELRAAIDDLSAARQQEQSFAAAVHGVTELLGSGREARFDTQLDATATARVSMAQLPDLLQIIREAVSNALRHGAARTVTLRLHEDGDRLALLVQDDGKGFDPAKIAATGHGLANLRARAALLRGELRVTGVPGTGTRVVLTFPAPGPAASA